MSERTSIGSRILEVAWDDPRAKALRDELDADLGARYDGFHGDEPAERRAARSRALAMHPEEIVATLMYSCRRCGNQPLTLVKHGSKFTLFFIPLFTVSTRWSLVCNFCREEYQISAEEAQHHRQVAAS